MDSRSAAVLSNLVALGSQPYQLLRHSPAAHPSCVAVLIPGNPGIVHFYDDFAASLCTRVGADVSVVGLAGHIARKAPGYASRRSPPTLKQQCAHLNEAIQPLAERSRALGVPLILLGHSIGAWLALKTAEALRAKAQRSGGKLAAASQVLLLTPYLQNNHEIFAFEAKYRALTRLPWLIPFVCLLGSVLGRLPSVLQRWLLPADTSKMEANALTVLREQMLCFGAVNNYLRLAATEFVELEPPFDFAQLRSDGIDVRLLYAEEDEWAPKSNMDAALREGLQADFVPAVQHAFCTRRTDTLLVTDWIGRQAAHVSDTQSTRSLSG